MSRYNVSTQTKLKNISQKATFEELLENSTLSDLDKDIFRLHYLNDKSFIAIGQELGYSESGVRKRHTKALKKLSGLI